MKRELLYSFIILGCLTSCSHLCLVPAIKNQDFKGGFYNDQDTCLEREYYRMSGRESFAPIIKGVQAGYEVQRITFSVLMAIGVEVTLNSTLGKMARAVYAEMGDCSM